MDWCSRVGFLLQIHTIASSEDECLRDRVLEIGNIPGPKFLAFIAQVLCRSNLNSFLPFASIVITVCIICTRILAIQSSVVSRIRT